MTEMAAIKIKILLKPDNSYDYPDFKHRLAYFQDNPGFRAGPLYYDDTSHCSDDTPDSPAGQRWGMKLVPPAFADQAVAAFPGCVSKMTEAEVEAFWNDKAHGHMPECKRDTDQLQGMLAELQLREALGQTTEVADLKAIAAKALDPEDSTPGVRKDPQRYWRDAKAGMGITIKSEIAPL